MILQDT